MLKGKLQNFANTYESMYNEGKGSIYQMQTLGLEIPNEFKISAQYALAKQFNELFMDSNGFIDDDILQLAGDINFEAKRLGISIDKTETSKFFSKKVVQNINRLVYSMEYQQADVTLELLNAIDKLEIHLDLSEAQNVFYSKIILKLDKLIESMTRPSDRDLVLLFFDIAKRLNFNIDYYRTKFDKSILS